MSQEIIAKTIEFVKKTLNQAEGGHDWWHIYRVHKMALSLAKNQEVDLQVIELGALLHDIADSKFHNGDESIGPQKAREFLQSIHVEQNTIKHVELIIQNISFKGGKHTQTFKSKELDIVQDADRLDAIGAVGIARAFNYGGYKGRMLYDPSVEPNLKMTKEEYKNSTAPTLNHFYEKLFLLKDRMNTATAKKIATERHNFMKMFVEQFHGEWNGKK